jgi:hypothetical protein
MRGHVAADPQRPGALRFVITESRERPEDTIGDHRSISSDRFGARSPLASQRRSRAHCLSAVGQSLF